ncbi:MAG: hypothetical protein HPY85_02700 [Anaerolineae bacterium]|nr:hypothetical protein [Anaerolineae bacterium]
MKEKLLNIGEYRPIYLWGGPGTIRMNRVKFMNQPVDEFTHLEAHEKSGAQRIVDNVYSNWVHLMYDWGFPPEIEQEDFESFSHGAEAYHQLGVKVFAYMQTSNCVFMDSYTDKDWYALDGHGRKIYYYTQRYMVDLLNPEWQEHLREMIRGAIERGADGIFFDNLWFGAMPVSMMGAWLGEAGCFTRINRELYRTETGMDIPQDVNNDSPDVRMFIHWRARKLTGVLAELAGYARTLKPDVLIGANDFDVVMRSATMIYGMNLSQLAGVQDITMIENYAIPKWVDGTRPKLVNNALTIRVAREWVKDQAHLSVLSYDDGIGWDGMYPPRRFLQTMAEAAACGASNTVKGTEFYHDGRHTVLSAEEFRREQLAIGEFQRWLENHTHWFSGKRENLAEVFLSMPEDALVFHWHETAPVFFGVAQTLTAAGIPWRCVNDPAEIKDGCTVFGFTPLCRERFNGRNGYQYLHIPDLQGWEKMGKKSLVKRHRWLRNLLRLGIEPLWHAYFSSKLVRKVIDGLRLFRLFTGTPYFNLPAPDQQHALLAQITTSSPIVSSSQPMLIESWQSGDELQVHLVNYSQEPQEVTVDFRCDLDGCYEMYPPHTGQGAVLNQQFSGSTVTVVVDLYVVFTGKKILR